MMIQRKFIVVKEDTKAQLDELKLCPTETYNNIIKRLIEKNAR